ncbi:MAG: L,D-transpeptidase [Porphyromonadaceae bacterium]|nr:L,D-transpeptidase [Porphyromonadaceae bacterium]
MRIRNLFALFFSIVMLAQSGCDADSRNEGKNREIGTVSEDTILPTPEEKKIVIQDDIVLKKDLQYDQYTLEDEYPYQDTVRKFQWEKIKKEIARLENAITDGGSWGVLSNYKNKNGEAPTIQDFVRNDYGLVSDQHGVERYQSVPLYGMEGDTTLVRYGRDGWLVKINGSDTTDFLSVTGVSIEGTYLLPRKYLIPWGDSVRFNKVVAVDVTNQHITTLEKKGETWHILSMNPATSGVHKPPHAHETPVGIFAIQEKKEKMYYMKDGTSEIAGYAPYASRFTNGAYIHGVPVQYPRKNIIEYSPSLGTTPRSHMCVRNASSHAKFVYEWATVRQSVVIVID